MNVMPYIYTIYSLSVSINCNSFTKCSLYVVCDMQENGKIHAVGSTYFQGSV